MSEIKTLSTVIERPGEAAFREVTLMPKQAEAGRYGGLPDPDERHFHGDRYEDLSRDAASGTMLVSAGSRL